MKYDKFTRRFFLQGASGFCLSIPLLPSLLPSFAFGALDDFSSPNFIFIRTPLGMDGDYRHCFDNQGWTISQSGAPVRTKKLTDIKDKQVNLYFEDSLFKAGLEDHTSVIIGGALFGSKTGHNNTVPLTASGTLDPNKNTDSFPAVKQSSIDNILGYSNKIYSSEPTVRVLRLSPHGRGYYGHGGSFSWSYNKSAGQFSRMAFETDMQKVFNLIFAKISSGGTPEPPTQNSLTTLATKQKLAMDFVLEEYKRAMSKADYTDRMKLEAYSDNVQEISRSLSSQGDSNATPTIKASCSNPKLIFESSQLRSQRFKLTSRMITAALQCNLTKVISLNMTEYSDNEFSGSAIHELSHKVRTKDKNAYAYTNNPAPLQWLAHQKFQRDLIIDLASELKAVETADGENLLHHSLVLHTSEMSGEHVTNNSIPVALYGQASGKINAGHFFDYRMRWSDNGSARRNKSPLWMYPDPDLIYHDDDNAESRGQGACSWLHYGQVLGGIMQAGGLSKQDYMLSDQLVFGDQILGYAYDQEEAKDRGYHSNDILSKLPPKLFKI